jgi:hypothetical protein
VVADADARLRGAQRAWIRSYGVQSLTLDCQGTCRRTALPQFAAAFLLECLPLEITRDGLSAEGASKQLR